MAVENPTLAPVRIPRFVRNLNAYAEARGFDVEVRVEPYSNDPMRRLWSNWRTTRARFLAFDLLTPGNHHLPCDDRTRCFTVPMGYGNLPENALLAGDMTVTGENVLWEIDCGPADFEIQVRGEVEIVTYADEIVYHGSLGALVDAGIDRKRLPTGKMPSKSKHGWGTVVPQWKVRRQPNGMFVYRVEAEKNFHSRRAEEEREKRSWEPRAPAPGVTAPALRPCHLRLVVDNTRPTLPMAS